MGSCRCHGDKVAFLLLVWIFWRFANKLTRALPPSTGMEKEAVDWKMYDNKNSSFAIPFPGRLDYVMFCFWLAAVLILPQSGNVLL